MRPAVRIERSDLHPPFIKVVGGVRASGTDGMAMLFSYLFAPHVFAIQMIRTVAMIKAEVWQKHGGQKDKKVLRRVQGLTLLSSPGLW